MDNHVLTTALMRCVLNEKGLIKEEAWEPDERKEGEDENDRDRSLPWAFSGMGSQTLKEVRWLWPEGVLHTFEMSWDPVSTGRTFAEVFLPCIPG